eukprot:3876832-Pyramimonas_sp.AAC.1
MVRGPQGTETAKKYYFYGRQLVAEEDAWTTCRIPGIDAQATAPSNLGPVIDDRVRAEAAAA